MKIARIFLFVPKCFPRPIIAKMGRQVVSCQPAISIFLYLRRSCFRKKSLNVSLRSKRFRSSYWSSSLLSNFRVKLARKRLLRRLLECCPTIPSMISWIRSYIILVYHWFSLDLQAPTPAIYLHADLVPYFLATGLAGNLLCRPVKKKY